MSLALWAVRMLRKLPHTRQFDRHLDDCAAVQILRRAFPERPPLRLAHVIGTAPLPSLQPSFVNLEPKRLKLTVITNEVMGSREAVSAANTGAVRKLGL